MGNAIHLAYYITAHGYGHGVRSCDILRALWRRAPGTRVTVVTDLPEPFLRSRLGSTPWTLRRGAFDVGMVQRDSIRVDLDATRDALADLLACWPDRVKAEAAWMREAGIERVVCDIPAIPLEAARAAGVPAWAVGNFSWDWIYEEFADEHPVWAEAARRFAQAYPAAERLLKLPFAPLMKTFPRQFELPLLAESGVERREELARLTGCGTDGPWVLLSFTTLDLSEETLSRVEAMDDLTFFTVKPLAWQRRNIHPIDRDVVPFSDVLASCDLVMTKPGFGILSECAVNDKPLVYADRVDFAEYHVLVEWMDEYMRGTHIPTEALYAGDWRAYIDRALRMDVCRPRLPRGGASMAARVLLEGQVSS